MFGYFFRRIDFNSRIDFRLKPIVVFDLEHDFYAQLYCSTQFYEHIS